MRDKDTRKGSYEGPFCIHVEDVGVKLDGWSGFETWKAGLPWKEISGWACAGRANAERSESAKTMLRRGQPRWNGCTGRDAAEREHG